MKTKEFIDLYYTSEVRRLSELMGFIVIESEFFPKTLKSLMCEKKEVIVYLDKRMKNTEKDYCLLIQIGRWLIQKEILDKGETVEKFVFDWIEKKLEE